MAESQEQMKRASEVREAENADYQQTISDQRLTQMVLQRALTRMREVYAFMQRRRLLEEPQQPGAAHTALSGTHTDPGNAPARFTKYEKNAGGSRVVKMLEDILADSVRMENEAEDAEVNAQNVYDNFMQGSNKALIAGIKKVADMTEARAKAKDDLTMAKTDFEATMGELEDLNEELGDLHRSCDFILQNFDVRQEARAAEINALQEAKAILSGMK